ncbi:MAG: ATP-binding protein [Armatimonadetes bacterium]|nr:ATP-binding protein [Armatimonadota bacterium]
MLGFEKIPWKSLKAGILALPRSPREPLLVSVLLLAIFAGVGVYIVLAAKAAETLREKNGVYRCETMAKLYSKIIASDVADSLKVIHSFEDHFFREKITLTDQEKRSLKEFTGLSPRLYQASVITQSGQCLYTTDPAFMQQLQSHLPKKGLPEIATLPLSQALVNLPTFFTPIPRQATAKGTAKGYLVMSFRPEGFSLWLLDFHITGTQVYVIDQSGAVIVSTSRDQNRAYCSPLYPPLQRARARESGAARLYDPFDKQPALIGYAPISQTRWSLLVVQTTQDADSEEDFPIMNLAQAAAPAIFFLPLMAWLMLNLYYRQVRHAQELAFHNTRLHLADQARADLLANVSHDLKTPLATLQLTLAGVQDPKLRLTVERQLGRLGGKVRNLLDMSRLESTTLSAPGLCELSEVVAEAVEPLRALLIEHPLTAEFPPEAIFLPCEAQAVATVVMNLLENAAKYAPPGTPIQLKGKASPTWVRLQVRDFGFGVPDELRERIFEKFYRIPGQRAHGTGLGLAICKTIIESYGGQIEVQSPPGGGAAFIVTLPRYREEIEGIKND